MEQEVIAFLLVSKMDEKWNVKENFDNKEMSESYSATFKVISAKNVKDSLKNLNFSLFCHVC